MNVKYLLTLKKNWNQAVIEYNNVPDNLNENELERFLRNLLFESLSNQLIKIEPWSEKAEKDALQKMKDGKFQ